MQVDRNDNNKQLANMNRRSNSKSESKKKKKYVCFNCGQPGHFKKDCGNNKQDSKQGDSKKADQKKKFVAAICKRLNNIGCIEPGAVYIDSGTNGKICHEIDRMHNVKPHFELIDLPNGSTVTVKVIGKLYLSQNSKHMIEFVDVLYIQELKTNYISEICFLEGGLLVKPTLKETRITTKNGEVILIATRRNSLLIFDNFITLSASITFMLYNFFTI